MEAFYFSTTLLVEEGPSQGERWLCKVRILAADETTARRHLIGWIAKNNEPPAVATATPEEVAHIRANWNRLRVLDIDACGPDGEGTWTGIWPGPIVFWWDRVVLPAAEEAEGHGGRD